VDIFERGGTVIAKVEDREFWQKVHEHAIKFGEGDMLRVRLRWKVDQKNGKLTQKNTIIRVYQVLDRPRQMRLDDGKDDVLSLRPKRNIRLEDD